MTDPTAAPTVDARPVRMSRPHEATRIASRAVDAARDEILGLSHRIHEHPSPPSRRSRPPAWVAETLRGHGYRRRASGGLARDSDPGDAAAAAGGGAGTADRDPRRVRRPARPRPRLRPQHDGGVAGSAPRSPWRRSPTSCRARSSSSARRPRSGGAASRSMIDDGLFEGIDAALLFHPVRPEPRRSRSRSRPRTSRSCSTASRRTPRPIRGGAGTPSTR